jgi:hypothetical protein
LLVVIEPKTPSLIRILARHGANFNVQNSLNGFTPLMSAVNGASIETIRAMLDAGADPNLKDYFGLTSLDEAQERVESGDLNPRFAKALLATLIRAGAKPGDRRIQTTNRKRRS